MSEQIHCELNKVAEPPAPEMNATSRAEDRPSPAPEMDIYHSFLASSPWPWLRYQEFQAFYPLIGPYTVVSPDRCYLLFMLASQAVNLQESFWECGVYKGGTAMLLADIITKKDPMNVVKLHLFDTFEGMPITDPEKDLHQSGDFADTDLESVKERVGHATKVVFHKGLIPESFAGMEKTKIAFAHIDLDIYHSILESCAFIYPRLVVGGCMLFDDYGFSSCPGARQAVDEYFKDKPETPLVLPSGQAVVFKQVIGLRAAAQHALYNVERFLKRKFHAKNL